MSFQQKYQILSVLNGGDYQSSRALEIASGRTVLVHRLISGKASLLQPDLSSLIFKFLRVASAEECQHFLDMGEDGGRVFVVTADVPECLDLRAWLQSVTNAHEHREEGAQPADGTIDPASIEVTRPYATEAMRQLIRCGESASELPPAGSQATPAVPATGKSRVAVTPIPPPKTSSVPAENAPGGPTGFAGLWEKSSPANPAGQPASLTTPPDALKSTGAPSEVPEVTAEFVTAQPPLIPEAAPTAAMTTLKALAAERERPPATGAGTEAISRPASIEGLLLGPPEGARSPAGAIADWVLGPPEPAKPPLGPVPLEASLSPPPPDAAGAPEKITETPPDMAELLAGPSGTPTRTATPVALPHGEEKTGPEAKPADKAPAPQGSMGFEVIFQSDKPRSHPTLSVPSDWAGSVTPPAPPPSSAAALPPAPAPASVPPTWALPLAELAAEKKTEGIPAGSAAPPGEQEQVRGSSPAPSPPHAPPLQSDAVARLLMTPRGSPMPPGRGPLPMAPPPPAEPDWSPVGEYPPMVANGPVAAGPAMPKRPPAGMPPPGNAAARAPIPPAAPVSTAYPAPIPQASPQPLHLGSDAGLLPPHQKVRHWIPVLILCSLMLMAAGLVLFFAFNH